MKNLNMTTFSTLTGFNYDFIKAVAKQHGSWKKLLNHVRDKGGINPLFAFDGFVLNSECCDFIAGKNQQLDNCIRGPRFVNSCDYGVSEIKTLFKPEPHQIVSDRTSRNLLTGTNLHSEFDYWHTYTLWLVLYEIGRNINQILIGEFSND